MNLYYPGRATLAGLEGKGIEEGGSNYLDDILEKFDIDKRQRTLSRIVA
jgi:hypothetical protein